MHILAVIQSQYLASLAMLEQAVANCPPELWDRPADRNKFWHVAYHALFYTHLYLQPTEAHFVPWTRHRPESNFMGRLPWPPHQEPETGEPYLRAEILEYMALCRRQVAEQVPRLDLAAASGFDWLPMNKLELQLYNLRHLMQHTGELGERLGAVAGLDLKWVGHQPVDEETG